MMGAATLIGIGGAVVRGIGTLAAGNAQAAAMRQQAAREREAARVQAAAQDRETKEKRREVDIVKSNLLAHAAASGLSVDSGDVQWLSSDIERAGTYEVRKSQWNASETLRVGETRARDLEAEAGMVQSGGRFGALTSFASGFASYADKFRPASLSASTGRSLHHAQPLRRY